MQKLKQFTEEFTFWILYGPILLLWSIFGFVLLMVLFCFRFITILYMLFSQPFLILLKNTSFTWVNRQPLSKTLRKELEVIKNDYLRVRDLILADDYYG